MWLAYLFTGIALCVCAYWYGIHFGVIKMGGATLKLYNPWRGGFDADTQERLIMNYVRKMIEVTYTQR